MKSVSAVFANSQRVYTYATQLDLMVGQRFVTRTPAKGWTDVTIHEVHKTSQLDPNAKFEYKELKEGALIHLLPVEVDGVRVQHATITDYELVGKGLTSEIAIADLCLQLNRL